VTKSIDKGELLRETIQAAWRLAGQTASLAAVANTAAVGLWLVAFRDLDVVKSGVPIVRLARLPRGRLALFRADPDEMIVDPAATGRPLVMALLHETVHQELGPGRRSGYHPATFREFARRLGLVVSERGLNSLAAGESVLRNLLIRNAVGEDSGPLRRPASSGLSLWLCGCKPPIKLRVGRREVRVRCEECGEMFARAT